MIICFIFMYCFFVIVSLIHLSRALTYLLQVACSIIGVPKSIENDVLLVDRCFGFETVVQEAERPLQAAKTEASSARKGVGLVKVGWGRQRGKYGVCGYRCLK
jgi:6-phosphofructokinase